MVPIAPETCTVQLRGRNITRKQLPLCLATASTVHNCQGYSVDQHVMSPAPMPRPSGHCRSLAYTALGRCRTLSGLILTARLDARHLIG